MKRIILAITQTTFCLLFIIILNAQQQTEIPKAVKYSFIRNFREAQTSRWVQVLNNYVCTFSEGLGFRDAYFKKDGEFRGIGQFIIFDMLPGMVQNTINRCYGKFEIFELYQYDSSEDGLCFYAVLRNSNHEHILKMSPDGDIIYSQKNKVDDTPDNLSRIAKIF